MNIEIANRLVQMRKKNHLSQEELAEKLGISRQAVSKWERAESSPDTDNLILLARLYHVSLDELLKTGEPVAPQGSSDDNQRTESGEKPPDKTRADAADAYNHNDSSYAPESASAERPDFSTSANSAEEAKTGPAGRSFNYGQPPLWGNNPQGAVPAGPHSAYNPSVSQQSLKKINRIVQAAPVLAMLVFQLIFGVVPVLHGLIAPIFPMLTVVLYLILGFFFQNWHPGWLVFLMIPVFYAGIVGGYPILITILFLLSGFIFDTWHPAWMLYLTIPIFYAIYGHIIH